MKKEEVRASIEAVGILPSVRVKSRDLALFAAETVYSAGNSNCRNHLDYTRGI